MFDVNFVVILRLKSAPNDKKWNTWVGKRLRKFPIGVIPRTKCCHFKVDYWYIEGSQAAIKRINRSIHSIHSFSAVNDVDNDLLLEFFDEFITTKTKQKRYKSLWTCCAMAYERFTVIDLCSGAKWMEETEINCCRFASGEKMHWPDEWYELDRRFISPFRSQLTATTTR